MNPIVSIMAQGSMGAATEARLVEHGIEVRTILAGRSAGSAERAAKAGMKPVSPDRGAILKIERPPRLGAKRPYASSSSTTEGGGKSPESET
jgi:hypothetical protein